MTFQERIEKLVEKARAKLAELEEEYDRLDNIPQKVEARNQVADAIRTLVSEIEGFEVLLKHLGKGKK